MDWIGFATTWVKAFHVISVIAWIAGMMYLPRLFVYHAAAEKGSIQSETFKIMERRLYRGIITPAMALTWIFGLTMVLTPGIIDWHEGWVWVKAVAVILLSASMAITAARSATSPPTTTPARKVSGASSTSCPSSW